MKRFIRSKSESLRKLHANQNGAEAGLERILLVAFIALPLLGLLIFYRGKVVTYIHDIWTGTAKDGPTDLSNGGQ